MYRLKMLHSLLAREIGSQPPKWPSVRVCSTACSRSLARNPSVSPEFSITEEPLFSISIYATTPCKFNVLRTGAM